MLDTEKSQSEQFNGHRSRIAALARDLTGRLHQTIVPGPAGDLPAASIFATAPSQAARTFDATYGGVADTLAARGKHIEGAFFTWTPGRLQSALRRSDGAFATSWYDVTDAATSKDVAC